MATPDVIDGVAVIPHDAIASFAKRIEKMAEGKVKFDTIEGVLPFLDDAATNLRQLLGELKLQKNMCVCIECGRCKIDEDGCCTTCGRDALLLEDGRLVNRDFGDNLEADVRRQTRDQIAKALDEHHPTAAAVVRAGTWKGGA
jgi:hypothetical protein